MTNTNNVFSVAPNESTDPSDAELELFDALTDAIDPFVPNTLSNEQRDAIFDHIDAIVKIIFAR
jgi:hypothetical protein